MKFVFFSKYLHFRMEAFAIMTSKKIHIRLKPVKPAPMDMAIENEKKNGYDCGYH